MIKNVTISVEESILREVRRIAAERSTSLNAMIREYLTDLTRRESSAQKARLRIAELCRQSEAEVGSRTWSREDLHER